MPFSGGVRRRPRDIIKTTLTVSIPQHGFQGHPPSRLRNYQSSGDNSSVPPCRRGARCPKESTPPTQGIFQLILTKLCSRRMSPRSPGKPGHPIDVVAHGPQRLKTRLPKSSKLCKIYSGSNKTWPSSRTPRRPTKPRRPGGSSL